MLNSPDDLVLLSFVGTHQSDTFVKNDYRVAI